MPILKDVTKMKNNTKKSNNVIREYLSDTITDFEDDVSPKDMLPRNAPDWALGIARIILDAKK